jgi:hypothetical protein
VIAKLHATHSFPFAFENVNVGTTVSITKLGKVNAVLAFHAASVTVTVHAAYVPSDNVLYVTVLFHDIHAVVTDVHHHAYDIVHVSVDENV